MDTISIDFEDILLIKNKIINDLDGQSEDIIYEAINYTLNNPRLMRDMLNYIKYKDTVA